MCLYAAVSTVDVVYCLFARVGSARATRGSPLGGGSGVLAGKKVSAEKSARCLHGCSFWRRELGKSFHSRDQARQGERLSGMRGLRWTDSRFSPGTGKAVGCCFCLAPQVIP